MSFIAGYEDRAQDILAEPVILIIFVILILIIPVLYLEIGWLSNSFKEGTSLALGSLLGVIGVLIFLYQWFHSVGHEIMWMEHIIELVDRRQFGANESLFVVN